MAGFRTEGPGHASGVASQCEADGLVRARRLWAMAAPKGEGGPGSAADRPADGLGTREWPQREMPGAIAGQAKGSWPPWGSQ